jgi:hypothetical protein
MTRPTFSRYRLHSFFSSRPCGSTHIPDRSGWCCVDRRQQRDAFERRLVRHELASKGPSVQTVALRPRGLNPLADVRRVFDRAIAPRERSALATLSLEMQWLACLRKRVHRVRRQRRPMTSTTLHVVSRVAITVPWLDRLPSAKPPLAWCSFAASHASAAASACAITFGIGRIGGSVRLRPAA